MLGNDYKWRGDGKEERESNELRGSRDPNLHSGSAANRVISGMRINLYEAKFLHLENEDIRLSTFQC